MAIVSNRKENFGDILFISTSVPAIGIVTLTSFLDDATGETGGNHFEKKFRYSLDGIQWSNWLDLTTLNIQQIPIDVKDTLLLEYRYEKVGTGLDVDEVTINGTFDQAVDPFYFSQSIFSKYFKSTNIEVIRWYVNVTEKLYSQDLARYVKFDDGSGDATDAISFWQTVAKFFAYYVVLAKIFNQFHTNVDITSTYLTQRGLQLANGNTLLELNYLLQDFNKEIARRGTKNTFKTKAQNNNLYDGEIRRLFNLTEDDEFIVDQYLPHHCGWWIDQASPLYRGLENHLNAQKFNYDTYFNHKVGTVSLNQAGSDPNNDFFKFISADTTESGFKKNNNLNFINVNTKQNYCLEFLIEVLDVDTKLNIGFDSVDDQDLTVNGFNSFKTGSTANYAVQNLSLTKLYNTGGYIPIKVIIYNDQMPSPFAQDLLNIQTGNNLKFKAGIAKKLYPILTISEGEVNIKNILLRPLTTEYERGFINMNNFVSLWA